MRKDKVVDIASGTFALVAFALVLADFIGYGNHQTMSVAITVAAAFAFFSYMATAVVQRSMIAPFFAAVWLFIILINVYGYSHHIPYH